eukprot:m.8485 g.8485  ORF g.8485 m.8485 type:complete len:708 (+) comp3907_c0_seq1:268-2391(+)
MTEYEEACIVRTKNFLLVLSEKGKEQEEDKDNKLQKTREEFCGSVLTVSESTADTLAPSALKRKNVYICGFLPNIDKSSNLRNALNAASRVYVVEDLSRGTMETEFPNLDSGRLPVLVHGVGVLYRRFFAPGERFFDKIRSEHTFQSLTESTKPNNALRLGLYLTPVERDSDDNLKFRLLRCSSNLSGPTETFRKTDTDIVGTLNQAADSVFEHQAPLNHVLAQIYRNTPASQGKKQTKAKIKAHADKTKDMPKNGIMAFCTFYDHLDKLQPMPHDKYDLGHKGIGGQVNASGLTTLHFRLKSEVAKRKDCKFTNQFSVTLYPDSVFFMPLSTNRWYTHEIRPSKLSAEHLPTRLGYVVRCSEREAIFKNGHTYMKQLRHMSDDSANMSVDSAKVVHMNKLEPPTREGMEHLRMMYAKENFSDEYIDYGDTFQFSMNEGDYKAPDDRLEPEFRCIAIPHDQNLFQELLTSVKFEAVIKGRQGTVIVDQHKELGTPIVRTTTKYFDPAQTFQPVHRELAQRIKTAGDLPFDFNNALVERYQNLYAKMGAHSDQAQDLAEGSHIGVFSCYKFPELAKTPPRKLVVEAKDPDGPKFEIPMAHNTAVVWSLETNRKYRHKIVLDTDSQPPENEWLGVTFRTSSSYVTIDKDKGVACLNGFELTLADHKRRQEFFQLRSQENKETDFEWPLLTYSISPSDLMPPTTTVATAT